MSTNVTQQGNIPSAMAWMIGLSAGLFWLGPIGALIAGFVGGRKAGSPGRALAASILPGAILWVTMFILGTALGWIPILGQLILAVGAIGNWVLGFMNLIPLVLGALLGSVTR